MLNLSVKNVEQAKQCTARISNTVRSLNRIAIRELKTDRIEHSFPKATAEDLKRLTSKNLEDTYKHARWVNPKDGKVYHILEEGRSKDGVDVRILSSEGEFIKNARLKNKTIVIFDQFKNLPSVRDLVKKLQYNHYPSHGEIVETYLRRTNPFATIERLDHKKNLFELIKYRGELPAKLTPKRFEELDAKMGSGHKVDYMSISEVATCDIGSLSDAPGSTQKDAIKNSVFTGVFARMKELLESMSEKGTRIFASASNELNNPEKKVNIMLAIDGVEGVGGLAKKGGKVALAKDSASRNSVFTQHYEQRNFQGRIVQEDGKILGINITGQPGVDLPYNNKTKHLLRNICGTSYSTPIRVGKISLNDMMEGII